MKHYDVKRVFTGNNRKKTKGRIVGVAEFTEETKVKKDMGFVLHKAVKHLVSTDPILGTKVYAKQGKAIKVKEIITLPEDTILTKKWGFKTWHT